MNTEISEHAQIAVDALLPLLSEAASRAINTTMLLESHQHGINLAVESKDRRISDLELVIEAIEVVAKEKDKRIAELDNQLLNAIAGFDSACLGSESKDREIERLKEELGNSRDSESKLIRDRYAVSEAYNQAVAQLTEANAKLAEAEKKLSSVPADWLEDSSLESWFSMTAEQIKVLNKENFDLMQNISSAQAEIERLKAIPSCNGDFACGGICPKCQTITNFTHPIQELKVQNETMLKVLQLTYLKHHCGNDVIGWDALSEKLMNALCNSMGDDAFQKWLSENTEDDPT